MQSLTQILQLVAVTGSGIVLLELVLWRILRGRPSKLPAMMVAPAFVVLSLIIIYPFFFQVQISFSNLNIYRIRAWLNGAGLSYVGFEQYVEVLTDPSFWILLGRTVLWTIINLLFHVGLGLGLALLLNREIWFKGIYRTLLIVPWAMPQVVAILAWRGEFHPEFGLINQILSMTGLNPINWWSEPIPVFLSCCVVNIWLGIPFMMIVFLGGLGSIPKSYYEAASIDGASQWSQFFQITLPMIKPVVVPSVTLGTIWTFNNINVIYLMTGQSGGMDFADILVSALYKNAFEYHRYAFSAAFAVIMFLLLLTWTIAWIRFMQPPELAEEG